ncbi:argininosuccinate lyase [Colletotrichum higginsianum]|nr:argininosuccinate lyase [Colletotrichum higginsianum]
MASNSNIHFDKLLYEQDILGSIAFGPANYTNGILTRHWFEMIERGLLKVEKEWEAGAFNIVQGNEGMLEGHLISFLKVTAARAEKEISYKMPGYAHLQRA